MYIDVERLAPDGTWDKVTRWCHYEVLPWNGLNGFSVYTNSMDLRVCWEQEVATRQYVQGLQLEDHWI